MTPLGAQPPRVHALAHSPHRLIADVMILSERGEVFWYRSAYLWLQRYTNFPLFFEVRPLSARMHAHHMHTRTRMCTNHEPTSRTRRTHTDRRSRLSQPLRATCLRTTASGLHFHSRTSVQRLQKLTAARFTFPSGRSTRSSKRATNGSTLRASSWYGDAPVVQASHTMIQPNVKTG